MERAIPWGVERRYLRFMRFVGRPRDWSFRLGVVGRFQERSSSLRERVLADIWLSTSAVEVTPREGREAQLPAKPRANTRRPRRGHRQGLR